jgi:hypothetical protein
MIDMETPPSAIADRAVAERHARVRGRIVVLVPVRIESSLNLREHWRTRANRNTSHRAAAFFALRAAGKFDPATIPCTVTITRIAPRLLDDDNLAGGAKSLRDGVADWLAIDDRDPRVRWSYAQRRGAPNEYAAEVAIERAA